MTEKKNEVLNQFVSRLKKEALLKAFLCALAIGFGALLITALACWLTAFDGYWIFAVTFLVPFGAAMPLFYFFVFYPTQKYVAKRLDQLGLDERIVTMVEFEDQDSYIMQRQREDAMEKLSGLNSKLIKFALSAALIAVPAVAIPTATAMTTVYALSEAEVIPSGKDLIGDLSKDKTTFELVYKIPDTQKGYGVLYSASTPEGAGEITLTVGRGQDGEAVVPMAAKGYVFLRWSDGVDDYIRTDTSVQGKIVVTAIFEEVGLDYGDDLAQDWSDPFAPRSSSGNRPGSDSSDGRGPYLPGDDGSPNGTGDGGSREGHNVDDGMTDFNDDIYNESLQTSMDELNQSDADSTSKKIASDYMGAISGNGNSNN